ncbi:DEAD/DEAH box helicase [Leptothrix cholodnii]|nr:DEAD/DEAH box helicase [Leptothrix cholodnii]
MTPSPADPALDIARDLPRLPHDALNALHALALGAAPRPRTWVMGLMVELGWRDSQNRRYTNDSVRVALALLAEQAWIAEASTKPGFWQIHPLVLSAVYRHLLDQYPSADLLAALVRHEHFGGLGGARGYDHFPTVEAGCALTRLSLLSGHGPAEVERLKAGCAWGMSWEHVFGRAVLDVLDQPLFNHLHPAVQVEVLNHELAQLNGHWLAQTALPAASLTETLLAWRGRPATHAGASGAGLDLAALRLNWAETLLLAGRHDEIAAVMQPLVQQHPAWAPVAQVLDAARLSRQADWPQALAGYEQALAQMKKDTGQRKGLLSLTLATPYVLSLMAQREPAQWQVALKFCLAEAGKRSPSPDTAWGLMALALQMRLGEARRDLSLMRPHSRTPYVMTLDWWRWLMRAWLTEQGDAPEDATLEGATLDPHDQAAAALLRRRLVSAGHLGLVEQLDAALAVIQHQPSPEWFFVPPPRAGWEVALAALAAIGSGAPAGPAGGAALAETRLWWQLDVSPQGALRAITPLEQKQGPRGWGKGKVVGLARLAKTESLPPWDAAVARCIRQNTADRSLRIDLAAAAAALIGHPLAAWADAPDLPVTLVEASPEIEVIDHGDTLQVRLTPPPRSGLDDDGEADLNDDWGRRWQPSAAELKEAEALRGLTLLRDEPQRARVIRYSAAQKRVAQLVGAGLTVPKSAVAQLQPVLHNLGAHFHIHADELQASREVPADPRLRAELTPEGDGVRLRLVVAPFGDDGPRQTPGHGRARLIAAVKGETLGAQRDLAAELGHLETVMDACPMLTPLPVPRTPGQLVPAQWAIENADATLALIERLHSLNAVAALDWPKGRSIRVDSVGIGQLSVQVQSGNEWLALQGGLQVDEKLVFSLGQLLDWSDSSRSRFVPLGEGRYLALTEELRARLDDLAAVAELQRKAGETTARLAPVAAAWLDSALAGAQVQTDGAFQDRLETLVRAQHWAPGLPATLQAQLRPYQEEGYQWAMRLAEAGLGAVLADDMGLGKTLQALAVLLERAAGGPALVVAPTSLIGNWQAEARRFAPTLNLLAYAEGDERGNRDALIEAAGPGDVIVVSYQMQQVNAEAFAGRSWHTLVLDEAQAIKNAAAKRSQAAFELSAGFRLALSGTPIENRLTELWSIMRVCNPGLLGTLAQFNSRFAVPIERDRHRGAQRTLRRLIAPFILRRSKAEVLDDLPPRTEQTLMVQGNATEQAHYEALRRQALRDAERAMSADGAGQAHLNILAQLMRLRRAACDPRLVTPDLVQPGAKVMAFGELAAELVANGHKALVFSQFVDFLALLREPLDAAGLRYQYLDGSTPSAERTRRVAAFQAGEGDFFLISLKAGGFGLNLTVADYVVIADPWWNPAAEDQASGRAHRIGQQRPVTVYRLVNKGTLEEKIVALHADKRELADSVLEADRDGRQGAGVLKVDELMSLMMG